MAENEESESIVTALKQYKPAETIVYSRDVLAGRYRIQVAQPLPQLSSPFAAAYNATDDQNPDHALYALVYESRIPVRQKNIQILKEFRHPNMVSLLESGIVEISTLSEARYVVILEKPSGQSVAQIFAQGRSPVGQAMLINNMLRPLCEILRAFAKAGISHGRIDLENTFISGETIILGESVSEPAGFSQDFVFESVERILTQSLAKPDFSPSADCYAFAVLTLHLLLGYRPVTMDKEQYVQDMLITGSYNMLVVQWDFSETMQDFFKGLLNDTRRERWDFDSIAAWLNGKQFNLINPSNPNEASRGFDYMGKVYYNRKAVADALFRHWPESHTVLSDTRLGRWVESSVHKPEAGEMIVRIAASSSNDNVRYERQNSELLARTLIMLDSLGPIRIRNLSVMVDGIGLMFANAFFTNSHDDMQEIIHILESDLPWFWVEQNAAGVDYSQTLLKLQRVRSYMRMRGLGFGPERCVYEMHPSLACQSRLVKRYHVTTLKELLIALDMLAPSRYEQDDCMDRHIAGFIAARIDIGKEIRISELEAIRKLAAHPALIGLKLLQYAQGKADNIPLFGLSNWMALKLMPLVDTIHRRSERKRLKKRLAEAAASGILKDIANLLLNPESFVADYNGFQQAVATYSQQKQQIQELKNSTLIMRHSRVVGRGIAQTIAYGVCLATVYYTLKVYMHF